MEENSQQQIGIEPRNSKTFNVNTSSGSSGMGTLF